MPDMNGDRCSKTSRRDRRYPRFLMISGNRLSKFGFETEKSSINNFLPKLTVSALVAKVEKSWRHPPRLLIKTIKTHNPITSMKILNKLRKSKHIWDDEQNILASPAPTTRFQTAKRARAPKP